MTRKLFATVAVGRLCCRVADFFFVGGGGGGGGGGDEMLGSRTFWNIYNASEVVSFCCFV